MKLNDDSSGQLWELFQSVPHSRHPGFALQYPSCKGASKKRAWRTSCKPINSSDCRESIVKPPSPLLLKCASRSSLRLMMRLMLAGGMVPHKEV